MHSLDFPTTFHKLRRKIVKKFRIGWVETACAEIIRSFDNTHTEVMLPKPVSHDSGRQRILGTCNPFSECRATTATLAVWRRIEDRFWW